MPDLDLLNDFAAYARALWKVPSKGGKGVEFAPNASQRIILYEINRMAHANVPVRIKILKSRQQGISTFLTAYLQYLCMTHPGWNALSIADKLELPNLWLRRAKRWLDETPSAIRPRVAASNRLELYFDDIGSRYSIGSEAGQTPGMGMSLQAIHCSEISNWRSFGKVMSDLLPAVPQLPGTLVALESTGEMEGDDWHEQVMLSLHGGDEFKLIFLPWWLTSEYRMPSKHDFFATPDEEEVRKLAIKWAEANPEHARIAKFKGLSNEQLIWRRWTIRNEFSGDLERFKSRYPSTIEEAFMGVGSLALPQAMVREHKRTSRPPLEHVRFERRDGIVQALPADAEDFLAWAIYDLHSCACEYTIGGDSASGKVTDPRDPRSRRERACLYVMNRRTLGTTAVLKGQYEPDILGEQMLLAAEYYNKAWIAPEINNTGYALVAAVRKYPYIIAREGLPDTNVAERRLEKIGWETEGPSRSMLISNWERYGRPDEKGFEGKVQCFSESLADEERTFVLDKNGKKVHRPGCFDDELFAAMLALQAHLSCPHIMLGQPAQRLISDEDIGRVGARKYSSIDRAGGRDTDWNPGEDDDE